jgi:hypothetical protein
MPKLQRSKNRSSQILIQKLNTISACKRIKLERSSTTMWNDLENKMERKVQEKSATEIATKKAQEANNSTLSVLVSYLQLWNTVLSAKSRELKNIRNCLKRQEENKIPSFEPSTITLKKSLIDIKYEIILDTSEFDLRVQTAMLFYEARLSQANEHESQKYLEFISNFGHTQDTERLKQWHI